MSLRWSSVGRANYVHLKLQKESHALWIGIKHSLGLKIDGKLACHLLDITVTVSNRRNSIRK